MSCLVKSRRPNGTVYIYRSTSVWDPEKGYPVPKRTLIGKLDPETGQVIPTRKQNRGKKGNLGTEAQSVGDTASAETAIERAQDHADGQIVQEVPMDCQEWDNSLESLVRKRLAKAKRLKEAVEREMAEMEKFISELDAAIQAMEAFDIAP